MFTPTDLKWKSLTFFQLVVQQQVIFSEGIFVILKMYTICPQCCNFLKKKQPLNPIFPDRVPAFYTLTQQTYVQQTRRAESVEKYCI